MGTPPNDLIATAKQRPTKFAVEEALIAGRKSGEQLRTMLDAIPTLVWRTSAAGAAEFFNQRWHDYTGISAEYAKGNGWMAAFHPDDLETLSARWMEIVASEEPSVVEARFRRYDGEYRWHLMRSQPLFDDEGKVISWCGTNTDIDDLKRAESFLAGEKTLLEMSAAGRPLQAILDMLCGIIEELTEDSIASIFLLDDDGKRLRLGAAPRLPEKYKEAIDGELIGPSAGSCGTAVFRGETIFVQNIAIDPLWASSKDLALAAGLLACFGTPILSAAGKILGALGLYSRRARGFTSRESRIMEQFTHLAGILIERMRAEDALAKSKALLAEGQRISKTGSWVWNLSTRNMVWSEEHCRIFGFEPDQPNVSLDSFLKSVHPADATRVQVLLDHAARRSSELSMEYRINSPDGSMKHIHSQGRPVAGRCGHAEEFVGMTMDITSRYGSKNTSDSEDQLRMIINTMPGLAWTAAPDTGEGEFLSEGWLTYSGMIRTEIQGYGYANAIHPDDIGRLQETWQKILTSKKPGELDARIRRFDGVYRWFTFRAAPLLDHRGNVTKWCGINVDIEDRMQAEIELRRSEAALRKAEADLAHVTRVTTMGELAASIAHEINQPIAGVVINGNACLRWLAREKSEKGNIAEAREVVKRIIRDGTRAGEVIARIRALFKKTEIAKESLKIDEVIREVVVLARSEIEKRRVILRLEFEQNSPRVLCDRVQIQQVMLNLILNAIEAMSTVDANLRELIIQTNTIPDTEIRVSVRDSGIGIDPASVEQIFTAFHTTKPGGLGMGLSISRSIVGDHGGRLWATKNDKAGATFQFALPLEAAPDN